MKKIVLSFLIMGFLFNFGVIFATTTNTCGNDTDGSVTDMLNKCQPDNAIDAANKGNSSSYVGGLTTVTTSTNGTYNIKDFKAKILYIATNLVILASLLAIGGIVYAGVLFTTAYGDDKKITKAKDAVKWSLIGFALALLSQQLINAIINLVYEVGK